MSRTQANRLPVLIGVPLLAALTWAAQPRIEQSEFYEWHTTALSSHGHVLLALTQGDDGLTLTLPGDVRCTLETQP